MIEMFIKFTEQGGVTIIPLILCSIISLAVIIERTIWGPKSSVAIPKKFQNDLKNLLNSKKIESALASCASSHSAFAKIAATAIKNRNKDHQKKIEAIEVIGKTESATFYKNLSILGTIAAISPLIGLLGTVFGMIKTFTAIQKEGVGDAAALAGGISEALITTAAGLSIAIPSLIFYRYFLSRAKSISQELETSVHEVSELLESNN